MSEFDSDTIQKILDLAPPVVHEYTDALGRSAFFSNQSLTEIKAAPYSVKPVVNVTTLTGFTDLIKADLELQKFAENWLIHIENENTVDLIHRESDAYGRRSCLIKATPVPFKAFRFGEWMDQESFSIAIAALFADGLDKDYVIQLASALTSEALTTSDDNGFVQKGTAQTGIRHKAVVEIKPRVILAPYRTFPELQQPESQFVFRARCDAEKKPALMLVEADGGAWKLLAMKRIAEFLKTFDLGIPIIA
jgi:hypothetical protein